MAIEQNAQISPRESVEHQWSLDEWDRQAQHAITMKNLEIELAREQHQAEIELKKLESKWASWLKIPLLIIKLPVFILFGFAYIVCAFTGYQPVKRFWDLLN